MTNGNGNRKSLRLRRVELTRLSFYCWIARQTRFGTAYALRKMTCATSVFSHCISQLNETLSSTTQKNF